MFCSPSRAMTDPTRNGTHPLAELMQAACREASRSASCSRPLTCPPMLGQNTRQPRLRTVFRGNSELYECSWTRALDILLWVCKKIMVPRFHFASAFRSPVRRTTLIRQQRSREALMVGNVEDQSEMMMLRPRDRGASSAEF